MLHKPSLLAAAFLVTLPALAQTPIRITADLTEAPRKLYHAEIDLPVKSGPNTFITTRVDPRQPPPHRPGRRHHRRRLLRRRQGNPSLASRRPGPLRVSTSTSPRASPPSTPTSTASSPPAPTDKIAVLEWEKLLLYPAHTPVRNIAIQPSVTVPAGWGIGTALVPSGAYDPNAKVGGTTQFQPTNVEQLQDSPVIAGEYFHEFPLAADISPKHFIDVVSDEPEDSNLRPDLLNEISNLVREADSAYASHHYNQYHFLLTLSDITGGEGLEHGQSSDNGVGEKAFAIAARPAPRGRPARP